MPYAFFRDTVNKMNPNKHTWMIYHTNLCTEIQQNTSPSKFIEEKTVWEWMINIKYDSWDLVVCNLASINIAKVNTSNKIREIMPIITRLLDNVITLNFYPVEEAKITSNKYRPIWIGYLWLAEFLAVNKISYTSDEAKIVVEDLMVEFSQQALLASIELSKERWSYPLFQWSDWSKWILFWEDYNCPEKLRNDNTYTLTPFEQIVDLIKEHWLRFGYMFAPAPNTSTALVVGTTAALLPIYKKYYTETWWTGLNVTIAPNINENNVWYYTEYTNCDLWKVIDLISVVQKYIDQSISFEWQINPAKTTPKDLYWYYFKAWKQWIKTVYYVRSQSLDVQDNCISCSG
jgi:ribonucleoside-diphosphate reductase alpha chain